MATNGLLPSRPPVETDVDAEFVSLDDAGTVFEVLSSTTSRAVLTALYDEPSPVSELAERTDTSMQNVDYHLDRLREAGLVEVVDTWYSSKGLEMKVYAPTSDPLILLAGEPDAGRTLAEAIDDPDDTPSTDESTDPSRPTLP